MASKKKRETPQGKKFGRGRGETRQPRSYILIVMEGETEEEYFKQMSAVYKSETLTLVHTLASTSSWKDIMKKAAEEEAPHGAQFDERWVVYDADKPIAEKTLQQSIDKAKEKNLQCAISNPCFEYWLILHHEYFTKQYNTKKCENKLKTLHPAYKKGDKAAMSLYMDPERLKNAMKRAKDGLKWHKDNESKEVCPLPSTTVHLLVQSIQGYQAKEEKIGTSSAQKQE